MARGRSTSARTQARETARARKAAADAKRRRVDEIEESASVEFEIARTERDAADERAAKQVGRLDELPRMRTDRVAALLGETPGEVKRLRKLLSTPEDGSEGADDAEPDISVGATTGARELDARASADEADESEGLPAGEPAPSSSGSLTAG